MIKLDSRELTEMCEHKHIKGVEELQEKLGIQVKVELMEAGDFVFLNSKGEAIGIERCQVGDLMGKTRAEVDGFSRIERQLIGCSLEYSGVILLVEGVYDTVGGLVSIFKKYPNKFFCTRVDPYYQYSELKALEVRLSELGIEVFETASFDATIVFLRTIYAQRRKTEEEHKLFKRTRGMKIPTRFTTNPAVSKFLTLCPRLSETVAIRMIEKYGTIWTILNTPKKELLEINGFGASSYQKLMESVGKDG